MLAIDLISRKRSHQFETMMVFRSFETFRHFNDARRRKDPTFQTGANGEQMTSGPSILDWAQPPFLIKIQDILLKHQQTSSEYSGSPSISPECLAACCR